MNKIIPKKIPILVGKRRPKDIVISISNTKKINKYIKWKPKFSNLNKILNSSYRWEKKLIKNF